MLASEFDYSLPGWLIAQEPAPERGLSRLMVLDRAVEGVGHARFSDLPRYLRPGDVLVINDTKVFPARLTGVKAGTGGRVEILLLKRLERGIYEALASGRARPGARLVLGGRLGASVMEDMGGGRVVLGFDGGAELDAEIEEIGRTPLPPYISPEGRDDGLDRVRYQTVYARKTGAVAAPTAGLHFSEGLIAKIKAMGVHVAPVTLHVGIGTFMPVREEVVERHVMEEEEYEIGEASAGAINAARDEGRRVIAVGTTSARTLESAAARGGGIKAGASSTSLYIYPGYEFKAVDALITNFHLPKSTLLMLVCALAGRERILSAYAEAIRACYRFYSFGDAMFIV